MMKLVAMLTFAFALVGAAPPGTEQLSTDRKVSGVITSVDVSAITIANSNHAVTGKIDPSRTKVTVNGKPGSLRDLQISAQAKAELCLDDVWLRIDTH